MTGIFKLMVGEDRSRTRVEMTPGEIADWITPVIVGDVNAEAQRRIYEVMPQYKQANLTARAAILAAKGSDNWTETEAEEWAAGLAQWLVIDSLRDYSNTLNLMDPIPQDYADDKWWS